MEEVVSQAAQGVGVSQLSCYTSFGLLNISITFSNVHLVFNFAFNFPVPMVWREPRNHADDCYFCLTNITGFNASSRKKIKYPNLRSDMRPVPNSDDLPVPTPLVNKDLLSSLDEKMPSREDSAQSVSLEDIKSTYSGTSGNEPHWITQEDLNDLDLYLSKQQSELLASRLKQWNLVQEDVRITSFRCFLLLFTSSLVWWRISWRHCTKMVLPSNTCLLCSQIIVLLSPKRASLSELLASRLKQWNLVQEYVRITSFRNRNKDLASFFDMKNKLCYCTNIPGLFTSLGLPHNPSEWCLFIDSSKRSLKGALLHNGNKYISIPIAYSVHLKESYDNMELLLESIKYSEYQWSLCGDLKVIGLLMGLQAGFTKYCCFLCHWDSRAVSQHYKQKDWGSRSTFVPGKQSLKENPLVDMNKVLPPPLHIKLGLMKNFMKALHKNGAAFQHLSTAAKPKEGIFVGPQIREVLKDNDFEELLNLNELRAWEAFKSVCSGFLGNTRLPDYQACIEMLLKSNEDIGCRMSLKIHFQGKWKWILSKWNQGMMGDFCWMLLHDIPEAKYTRSSKKTPFWLWYYELCNCVIQVHWINQCSLSILFYLL